MMAVERLRSVTMLVLLSLPLTVTPLRAQGADADSEAVRRLAEKPTTGGHGNDHFVLATFLDAAGDRQQAIEHYREAARSPYRQRFATILSWIRLRELGEDPHKLTPQYQGIEVGVQ